MLLPFAFYLMLHSKNFAVKICNKLVAENPWPYAEDPTNALIEVYEVQTEKSPEILAELVFRLASGILNDDQSAKVREFIFQAYPQSD